MQQLMMRMASRYAAAHDADVLPGQKFLSSVSEEMIDTVNVVSVLIDCRKTVSEAQVVYLECAQ